MASGNKRSRVWRRVLWLAVPLPALVGLGGILSGCGPCGPGSQDRFEVRGTLLEADSTDPLSGAGVGGRLLVAASVMHAARTPGDGTEGPLSNESGLFGVVFYGGFVPECAELYGFAEVAFPDEVVIVVGHDGCGHTFRYAVDEESFIDPTAPDNVLELREPVLVPACEE